MKKPTVTKIFAFLIIGFLVLGVTVFADDIKARMKSRLPVIKKLKAQGIVGEDVLWFTGLGPISGGEAGLISWSLKMETGSRQNASENIIIQPL